jgi:hypothetical protein
MSTPFLHGYLPKVLGCVVIVPLLPRNLVLFVMLDVSWETEKHQFHVQTGAALISSLMISI